MMKQKEIDQLIKEMSEVKVDIKMDREDETRRFSGLEEDTAMLEHFDLEYIIEADSEGEEEHVELETTLVIKDVEGNVLDAGEGHSSIVEALELKVETYV